VLGGDNLSFRDLFRKIAPRTGIRAPRWEFPDGLMKLSRPFDPLVARLLHQEPEFVKQGIDSLRGSWMASSAKAQSELGYTYRSADDGVPPVVAWYKEH
jgi:nucleoside-diphosphate-sugar epimerase